MTFAFNDSMLSLQHALGVPSTKIPIDRAAFLSYVLPPIVGSFVVARLALTSQARTVRIALWPLVALLALRAALSLDMTLGKPENKYFGSNFLLFTFSIAVRTLSWAFAKEPLVRHLRPTNWSPSTSMDALDLTLNYRGIGWKWSRRLYVPRETRPVNRIVFVLLACLSVIAHGVVAGVCHRVIVPLVKVGPSSEFPSIFDDTLPFFTRHLRASIISVLAVTSTYGFMQMVYNACTTIGILVLGQDTAQWPPAFDAPWRATSLGDFWGRRWHQFFRQIFLVLGGYPLSLVLGRAGIVIGAFIASAVWHHTTLLGFDSRTEFWRMLVGFGMMAPGVLAEGMFQRLTGRRVGGILGWVWTMAWLMLWGTGIVEGFARTGMYHSSSAVDQAWTWVDTLVVDFDTWLHAI